ncbi:uncharacterized protein BO97DRAFT_444158 [Aspergillus homomorphus CBS 101889]|uniref:Mitochondrial inner membrane protease subunit 2 n=1 Tax=Aspergillus homomorphus (strain CBS 101889) TaxID=1450537 RepID=A0A395HTG9_ASPHC|nr:hypothetical protein BO97DRAFT_444158 [Aspergillus homomorphus CBS 101889]RAL11252.1 hypothetical protein BO97DRAFT_444158 [Aspergillus homomorphus CBS 101889]
MPPPTPKPIPKPRPRVLSPEQSKALRRASPTTTPTPQASTTIPQSQSQFQSQPQSQTQQQQPPRHPNRPSFFAHLRTRYATLPLPFRRSVRVLGAALPLLPIGLFFSEHVLQVMWVRGPSMTPYLNEDYEQMHTTSDMVLVNMWGGGGFWPWERKRRLERGMLVTFR